MTILRPNFRDVFDVTGMAHSIVIPDPGVELQRNVSFEDDREPVYTQQAFVETDIALYMGAQLYSNLLRISGPEVASIVCSKLFDEDINWKNSRIRDTALLNLPVNKAGHIDLEFFKALADYLVVSGAAAVSHGQNGASYSTYFGSPINFPFSPLIESRTRRSILDPDRWFIDFEDHDISASFNFGDDSIVPFPSEFIITAGDGEAPILNGYSLFPLLASLGVKKVVLKGFSFSGQSARGSVGPAGLEGIKLVMHTQDFLDVIGDQTSRFEDVVFEVGREGLPMAPQQLKLVLDQVRPKSADVSTQGIASYKTSLSIPEECFFASQLGHMSSSIFDRIYFRGSPNGPSLDIEYREDDGIDAAYREYFRHLASLYGTRFVPDEFALMNHHEHITASFATPLGAYSLFSGETPPVTYNAQTRTFSIGEGDDVNRVETIDPIHNMTPQAIHEVFIELLNSAM